MTYIQFLKHHAPRAVTLILFCVLLFSAVSCGGGGKPEVVTTPPASADSSTGESANTAPDFTVLDGEGKQVRLSDFVGKPVVLNFWASWCPPCKAEMPDFEAMYKSYGDRVAFLIVNLTDGSQETVASAKAYVESCGYTFPVYYDTTMQAAIAYEMSAIPGTFFINDKGELVTYIRQMISAEMLEEGIGMILEE